MSAGFGPRSAVFAVASALAAGCHGTCNTDAGTARPDTAVPVDVVIADDAAVADVPRNDGAAPQDSFGIDAPAMGMDVPPPPSDNGITPASDGGTCGDLPILAPGASTPGCGQSAPVVRDGPTAGMKLVPGGPFWRGCNAAIDMTCQPDERPGTCVTLPSFEIDTTEVTQEAYAACVAAGGCSAAHQSTGMNCGYAPAVTPHLPIACVDWNDADTFCRWAGKRLPTEAEWEKAARGVDGRMYPWGNTPPTCDLANLVGCRNMLQDVGLSMGQSPYGLRDMAGNVWEWVSDWYDTNYWAVAPACAPTGPAEPFMRMRVGRGGGFEHLPVLDNPAIFLRSAFRHPIDPTIARIGIGFRCARSVP